MEQSNKHQSQQAAPKEAEGANQGASWTERFKGLLRLVGYNDQKELLSPAAAKTEAPQPKVEAEQSNVDPEAGAKIGKTYYDDAYIKDDMGVPEFTPDEQFFQALATTENQQKVMAALQTNAEFKAIWDWFVTFPGGNPIRLMIVPGFQSEGVERFGCWISSYRLLLINPSKAEHVSNPMELVDTVVHELIHACMWVHEFALERNIAIPKLPFANDVVDLWRDPKVMSLGLGGASDTKASYDNRPHMREYMESNYGDGASNPEFDYIDINASAQQAIIRIIDDLRARTDIGTDTLTYANEHARQEQARLRKGRKASR